MLRNYFLGLVTYKQLVNYVNNPLCSDESAIAYVNARQEVYYD